MTATPTREEIQGFLDNLCRSVLDACEQGMDLYVRREDSHQPVGGCTFTIAVGIPAFMERMRDAIHRQKLDLARRLLQRRQGVSEYVI